MAEGRGALWAGRGRSSRGAAALEFALVMPVLLGLLGISLAVGIAALGRFQMMDIVHVAVRSCAGRVETVQNIASFNACVGQNIQVNMPKFARVCTLAPPNISGLTQLRSAPPEAYALSATLSCPFTIITPLLSPLDSSSHAFTIQASSTAPALPRHPP